MTLGDVAGQTWAAQILFFGLVFTCAWYLDHKMHLKIWKKDISDGELRTHRMILYPSYGLLITLVLMRWFPYQVLPFFAGFWITRTLHEFLDELHWHLPRCSERETFIHLVMWIAVQGGIVASFIWGFFFQFKEIDSLPVYYYIGFTTFFIANSYIGYREINDYRSRN